MYCKVITVNLSLQLNNKNKNLLQYQYMQQHNEVGIINLFDLYNKTDLYMLWSTYNIVQYKEGNCC